MNIQLTERDVKLLREEYDNAIQANLSIIFFHLENAPKDHYVELVVDYIKQMLEIIEHPSQLPIITI